MVFLFKVKHNELVLFSFQTVEVTQDQTAGHFLMVISVIDDLTKDRSSTTCPRHFLFVYMDSCSRFCFFVFLSEHLCSFVLFGCLSSACVIKYFYLSLSEVNDQTAEAV